MNRKAENKMKYRGDKMVRQTQDEIQRRQTQDETQRRQTQDETQRRQTQDETQRIQTQDERQSKMKDRGDKHKMRRQYKTQNLSSDILRNCFANPVVSGSIVRYPVIPSKLSRTVVLDM